MGALVSLAQREEVRRRARSRWPRRRPRWSPAIPEGRRRRRRRRARRFPLADPAARRGRRQRASPTRSRPSARSAPARLRRHRRRGRDLAARGRGQPGGQRRLRRPGLRPRRWSSASPRGTAGCWSSTATTPRSPPATARRCRTWSTAGRAGPAAARSSAASAACCTTCSAPPSRPARTCSRRSPGLGGGRRPRRASTRSASTSRTCRSATDHRRSADRDPGRHRGVRRAHRRPVLRPHGRGGGGREPVLRRPGGARLLRAVPGGGPVRRPRARAGPGELRPGEPAVRDARLSGRRAHRDADRGRDLAAGDAATARSPGTPWSPTRTEPVAAYDVLTLVAKQWPPAARSQRRTRPRVAGIAGTMLPKARWAAMNARPRVPSSIPPRPTSYR